MTLTRNNKPLTGSRLMSTALAALGAASAIPIPLAQLDSQASSTPSTSTAATRPLL
jgi:hypothetical protein